VILLARVFQFWVGHFLVFQVVPWSRTMYGFCVVGVLICLGSFRLFCGGVVGFG